MKDIALIGGMNTGKTTLAKILHVNIPGSHYVYVALYGTKIPMTLQATSHPNLLKESKERFIEQILQNQYIDLIEFPRQEMDEFTQNTLDLYGEQLEAEIAYNAMQKGVTDLIDNVAKVKGVQFLKDRGVYIVGLKCDFETRIQRGLERRKAMDPVLPSKLRQLTRDNDVFLQIVGSIELADVVYNTTNLNIDYPGIVAEIVQVAK